MQDVIHACVVNRLQRGMLASAARWERELVEKCQFSVYSSNTVDFCILSPLHDLKGTLSQAKQVVGLFEDMEETISNYPFFKVLVLTVDFLLVCESQCE